MCVEVNIILQNSGVFLNYWDSSGLGLRSVLGQQWEGFFILLACSWLKDKKLRKLASKISWHSTIAKKPGAVTPYCKHFIFTLGKVCNFQTEVRLFWHCFFSYIWYLVNWEKISASYLFLSREFFFLFTLQIPLSSLMREAVKGG